MNHDKELIKLSWPLKMVSMAFANDILEIKDPRHRIEMQQKYDKFIHWAIKMTETLDDMNEWLTAFGPGVDK